MPPATSLRSRIAAFENGAVTDNTPDSPPPEGSRARVGRDSSELLDVPISPTANSKFPLLKPSVSPSITPPRSRSESPDGFSVGTSVIDLSELDQPIRRAPQIPVRPSSVESKSQANTSSRDSSSSYDASRFSFDMASSRSTDSHVGLPMCPPVPSRKPAFLQSGSQFTSPSNRSQGAPSPQPTHDTSDTMLSSWYQIPPPSSPQFLDVHSASAGSSGKGHGHTPSTSSLQSVSLSSDGDPGEPEEGVSTPSVAETIAAFNNKSSVPTTPKLTPEQSLPYVPRKNPRLRDPVPAFAITGTGTKSPPPTSPAKQTPPPLPARKPTLPARPSATSSASSGQSVPLLSIRRVAPPPIQPPAVPWRSNLLTSLPTTQNSSAPSERRKTPIPLAAQKRYEMLFNKNVERASASRTPPSSSGWRGANSVEGASPRISGAVVKSIWMCSRLPKATLRQIWAGCDPDRTGSLDRGAFVRGMWTIDLELSKAAKMAARRQW